MFVVDLLALFLFGNLFKFDGNLKALIFKLISILSVLFLALDISPKCYNCEMLTVSVIKRFKKRPPLAKQLLFGGNNSSNSWNER